MGRMRKVSYLEKNKKSPKKELALPMQRYKEDMPQEIKDIKELHNPQQPMTHNDKNKPIKLIHKNRWNR